MVTTTIDKNLFTDNSINHANLDYLSQEGIMTVSSKISQTQSKLVRI
jgi:hypothetical protein